MIRIQQYNTGPRRIGVGGIDPGYQQPRIGNIAATAENQLAGTVLEAGKALTNVAIKEYVSTETTRVSQSLLAMQKELSAERDGYMAENQGQNAIEAGQHFEKFARETAQKYFQEGGFSGRFAEMFNKQAALSGIHFTEQGQAYAKQQKAAWDKSVQDGEVENFLNLVAKNHDNPEFIELNQQALFSRLSDMRPGLDNRALFSQINKSSAGIIVKGFLSHGDLKGAEGAVEHYRDLLGSDVNQYEIAIRNEKERLKAKAEADRAKAVSNLLFGLEDAKYAARYMGDTSQLTAIGEQLKRLGDTKRAEIVSRQARFWSANNEARDYAVRAPIEDIVSSITALDKRLTAEKDSLSVEEFQKESQRRDAMSEILKDRVAALKADPALAADRDPAVVLPDGATTGDRITARMEYQAMNGITESNRMPLTKTEAASLAEKWRQGGVEQKAALLYGDGGIIKEFGPYALNVMAQIGISETEQDYAQRVMDNPENATAASTILRVQNINEKDLPSVKVTDALEDVLERSTVYQSRRAMTLKVDSAAALSAAKQLETVAERMLKQGYSADEVVKTLDAGVVGVSDSNMALTYPAGRSATVLEQRLNRAFTDDLPGFFENDPRLSKNPLDIKYQIARLRNVGVWTNAPDGKGYVLVDGVTKRPVTDGNGNIFTVKSKDIFENPSSAVPDSLLNIQGGAW